MSKPQTNLPNLFFISLPENLNTRISGFTLDPSVLLPVEIPPGEEELRLENLSWEMIIAGMLKILAYEPEHVHAGYYRRFVLAAKPDVPGQLEQAGLMKAREKEFELAEDIFRALAGLMPDSVAYILNLALLSEERSSIYGELKKTDLEEYYLGQAFEYYKKALSLDPEGPETCYSAGYFFLKNGNIEKAENCFRLYLKKSGNDKKKKEIQSLLEKLARRINSDILFKEAFDFIQLGREEEGIKKIRIFLGDFPDYPNAWFLLGWAYRRLKQYEKGRDAFLHALELDMPHTDTLNELAICLMELGDFSESRERLAQALTLEPENTKILSNLAILSLKENNEEDAEILFNQILEADPADAIAREYLAYLKNR
ncbi:MAG: tetratricopeptide repeat protein [Spirochaetales bacterium]|nr:MAG: tetratricopeptide repeat protein [Spirochaetales bacterium]